MALALAVTVMLGGCVSTPESPTMKEDMDSFIQRATLQYQLGRLDSARADFESALVLAEVRDDRKIMSTSLVNLGTIELALDNLDAARNHYQRAITLADTDNNDLIGISASLGLANTYQHENDTVNAGRTYQQVLDRIGLQPPDQRSLKLQIQAMNGLALSQKATGNIDLALQTLAQAQLLAKDSNANEFIAATLYNEASFHIANGDIEAATASARNALETDREVENFAGIAKDLELLARIENLRGNPDKARAYEEQAERIQVYLRSN